MRTITVPQEVVVTIAGGAMKSDLFSLRRTVWRIDPRFSANFGTIELGMKIAAAFDEAEKSKATTITIEDDAWTLLDDIVSNPNGGYMAVGVDGKVLGGIGDQLYPLIVAVKHAVQH